jgi:hypothetical protein
MVAAHSHAPYAPVCLQYSEDAPIVFLHSPVQEVEQSECALHCAGWYVV